MSLCSPASSLRLVTHASRGGSAIHLGSRLTARKRRPASGRQASPPHSKGHAACHVGTLVAIVKNGWRRIAGLSVTMEEAGGAGWRYSPYNLEISRRNAGTDITSLDCCQLRAEAEAQGAQTLSVCADAGAAVSVQPGVRGLREDSVSAAHFEERIDAGRVFQGRG